MGPAAFLAAEPSGIARRWGDPPNEVDLQVLFRGRY